MTLLVALYCVTAVMLIIYGINCHIMTALFRRAADRLRIGCAPGVVEVGEGQRTILLNRVDDSTQAPDRHVTMGGELLWVFPTCGVHEERLDDDHPHPAFGPSPIVGNVS